MTSFGESHGRHVGVVIDGCPANVELDFLHINAELKRRRPGQNDLVSTRNEIDDFEITSGVVANITTGAPICILINNKDTRPVDYENLTTVFRPSHADYTYQKKYGIRDVAGGGRSSARITAGWVAAGAIAKQILKTKFKIEIKAYVKQIGQVICPPIAHFSTDIMEKSMVRCPHEETSSEMVLAIEEAKKNGDSLGGIIHCSINNCPIGVGEPVFNKLNAQLAFAMLSINAAKGFEIGGGFDMASKKGSEVNDEWTNENGKIITKTNYSGGIQGGISNGMPIEFRVAFKPTSTIAINQNTVNLEGKNVELKAKGRHDACVVPRAVPIVEAMAALVLVDNLLCIR
ncbi:MAG: chorismate synthase [Bacteroidia bacterium]